MAIVGRMDLPYESAAESSTGSFLPAQTLFRAKNSDLGNKRPYPNKYNLFSVFRRDVEQDGRRKDYLGIRQLSDDERKIFRAALEYCHNSFSGTFFPGESCNNDRVTRAGYPPRPPHHVDLIVPTGPGDKWHAGTKPSAEQRKHISVAYELGYEVSYTFFTPPRIMTGDISLAISSAILSTCPKMSSASGENAQQSKQLLFDLRDDLDERAGEELEKTKNYLTFAEAISIRVFCLRQTRN